MEKNCTVYISLGMLFLFDLKRFVVWLDFGVGPLLSELFYNTVVSEIGFPLKFPVQPQCQEGCASTSLIMTSLFV
jgi:hypothetical protein